MILSVIGWNVTLTSKKDSTQKEHFIVKLKLKFDDRNDVERNSLHKLNF